jgi:hypothetical protein
LLTPRKSSVYFHSLDPLYLSCRHKEQALDKASFSVHVLLEDQAVVSHSNLVPLRMQMQQSDD